jgi:hypothetical protein
MTATAHWADLPSIDFTSVAPKSNRQAIYRQSPVQVKRESTRTRMHWALRRLGVALQIFHTHSPNSIRNLAIVWQDYGPEGIFPVRSFS